MEWISRAVKKRIFAMAVLLSCLLGISIATCDLALNLAAETSVSQTTLLWLLAAFCIVSSVAAILHGILAADNGKGKSTRGVRILTRVLFWGLLLIFPYLLAEGHSYSGPTIQSGTRKIGIKRYQSLSDETGDL